MRGVEVKREESVAQIKERKIWPGECNEAAPPHLLRVLSSSFLFLCILALRLTGSFAPPTFRFSRRALELRASFPPYCLFTACSRATGNTGRSAGKTTWKSPRNEFPDTFSSIYGVTVPRRIYLITARDPRGAHCFIRAYVNFRAPRREWNRNTDINRAM